MTGNHLPQWTNYERLVLLSFVVAVCWVALDAWQPPTDVSPVAASTYTRRQSVAEMLRDARTPSYRWLMQQGRQFIPPSPQQPIAGPLRIDKESQWLPIERQLQLVPINAPHTVLLGIDGSAGFNEVPLGRLLEPTNPHARWLASESERWDYSHPVWQLAVPPLGPGWGQVPLDVFVRWRNYGAYITKATDPRHYASPPSLLHGPMLSRPGERFAMLPTSRNARTARADSRRWDEYVIDAARPYLATGVDSALERQVLAEPSSLVELLRELALEPHCSDWAVRSLAVLRDLTSAGSKGPLTTDDLLAQLANLSQQAETLAQQTNEPGLATSLRRARYAMWRRIDVWRAVNELVVPPADRLALVGAALDGGSEVRSIDTSTPVPVDELLGEIEKYETTPSKLHAKRLEQQVAQLTQSPSVGRRALADTVYSHYRNANARIAITDELVNRFMPVSRPKVEPIRDRILGTPVSGHATAQSAASVSLLPDPNAWRLGLEITGHANSRTVAFERTVRVRTAGTTQFAARQQLVIDGQGMRLGPVVADANSTSRFLTASSQYDPLPLVGNIIRSRAANAFSQRRKQAQSEVAVKTEYRVQQEVGNSVHAATEKARQQWQSRVVAPLAAGGVAIEPVELQTTTDRLIARVRIARGNSLTAHTPRPRAPSDSLASCQIHESALSNLAQSLDLAGKRLSAQEFVDQLARVAPRMEQRALDDDARDTIIEFGGDAPVKFELTDNSLHVAWEIEELVVRGRAHRNFTVHVYYTASTDGLVARLDHARGPYLEGTMRNAQRMRLQTIFGKVFPEGAHLDLGTRYAKDHRLTGLMITQLVIDDGWIAVALGPQAPQRTAQLDRYAPLR